MAMNGSVQDKLLWLFKLYDKDKDGNGEISQEEMEDVFLKMCKIVEKTEVDHMKKHQRLAEAEMKKKALALELKRERELRRAKEDMYEDKRAAMMYSERRKRLEQIKLQSRKTFKKKKKVKVKTEPEEDDEEDDSDDERVVTLRKVAAEVQQPGRDCKKFDPVKRSRDIFHALDANNDGCITEDEFVKGCLSDETFIKVMDDLCLDFLWGI